MDALRGVAAIAVMLYHAPGSPLLDMPGGFFAVDLFFMLSGFVIAENYGERLKAGMNFGHFMRLRAARLWPMLALGGVLGIVLHGGHAGMVFLLPNPKSPMLLYPSNPSLWSLLLEVAAYIVFAAWLARQRIRTLAIVLAACAILLLTLARDAQHFSLFGTEWGTLLAAMPRVMFGFTAGVVIHRLRTRQGMRRKQTRAAWLIVGGLGLLLALLPMGSATVVGLALGSLAAIVWLSSMFEIAGARWAGWLGACSYPLYCIHRPIIEAADLTGFALGCLLIGLIVVGVLLDRLIDAPARRWLARYVNASEKRLATTKLQKASA